MAVVIGGIFVIALFVVLVYNGKCCKNALKEDV